ncbi:MAG: dicarboxylate/amino acid:cation symporter [Deltaproteobacteria bacterium]|nr:dicarboxylate/amino acid:cation symporter [Deltaproteobacteria bacterium]
MITARSFYQIWKAPGTILAFAILGLLLGYYNLPIAHDAATVISDLFVNLLKLLSLPMIFLSIVSTLGGMKDMKQARSLGGQIFSYTALTTLLAAAVAIACYLFLDPAGKASLAGLTETGSLQAPQGLPRESYWKLLIRHIPANLLDPFIRHDVLGVLFLALMISAATLGLPEKQKNTLNHLFSSLFALFLRLATIVMTLVPIAIAAFTFLFVRELDHDQDLDIRGLITYLLCIVSANLIQACLVLPSILLWHKINPIRLVKAMWPALTIAFFGKSSSAALPTVIQCAELRANISRFTASFSFPICATINMNACAAFIIISVLFVSEVHGATLTSADYISWLIVGSIAAAGNAAVPMGCYFLATSLLAAQGTPLTIMGAILPFYALLDMLETAINVWSDSCVTAIVDQKQQRLQTLSYSSESSPLIPS